MGINRFALPVAEQAKRFIAPRSTDDEALRRKEAVGHRKRAHTNRLSKWRGGFTLFALAGGRASKAIYCAAVASVSAAGGGKSEQ